MNEYAELRARQQEEFNALPLGFAFNDRQFAETMQGWGLDPEKDLDKICSIGYGGFVQKKDAGLVLDTTTRHEAELSAAIAEDRTGDGFIRDMFLCELADHEYSYTMDLSDTLDALGYTPEDILTQCRRLDRAGIGYNFFYLTGIAGAGQGERSAIASAEVFNRLHPRLIGSSMLTLYPDSRLYQEMQAGNWTEAGEVEKYEELKALELLERKERNSKLNDN